ncbi:type II-A CRISPR-associated protein Csn2 [Streptococcus suis]|nr:type II-A CRISPR-associated protein Csn2 [Streptococcus suis]
MKLNFPLLDDSLDVSSHTILVVQSKEVFAQLIKEFYTYDEASELRLYDSKQGSLKPSELMVITDILGYDVNATSILKLVHADLENQFNDKPEVKSMIEKLTATITELIAFECLENELDLEYDEITILELIKALGIRIETTSDSIFEKCFEIIQIYKYLRNKKLLVFINISAYLSQKEIGQLFEYIELNHMDCLFLEPRQVYDFPQYILDEDYFLIAQNMLS